MLIYITGVAGSGKTYKAVYELYKHFGKDSKTRDDKFEHCYTNINQFDFSLVDDRVKKFDYDDFKTKITELHNLYKRKVTDDELNQKAKEIGLYKALFVIDEAHNFFQNRDATLIWWLTYHRHLYQDIYLITQNLSLVESKYKPLAEYFYKAVPASLRINKKVFKYNIYIDSRMTKASKVKSEKLPFKKEVYDLYHSGDIVKSPNFILRILLFSLGMLFLLSIGFYLYENQLKSQPSKDTSKSLSSTSQTQQKPIKTTPQSKENLTISLDSDMKYKMLHCNTSYCIFEKYKIPIDVLVQLFQISQSKILLAKDIPGTQNFYLYALVSQDFLNYFRSSNEKDNLDINLFGSKSSK